jgi:hypothetical protein
VGEFPFATKTAYTELAGSDSDTLLAGWQNETQNETWVPHSAVPFETRIGKGLQPEGRYSRETVVRWNPIRFVLGMQWLN